MPPHAAETRKVESVVTRAKPQAWKAESVPRIRNPRRPIHEHFEDEHEGEQANADHHWADPWNEPPTTHRIGLPRLGVQDRATVHAPILVRDRRHIRVRLHQGMPLVRRPREFGGGYGVEQTDVETLVLVAEAVAVPRDVESQGVHLGEKPIELFGVPGEFGGLFHFGWRGLRLDRWGSPARVLGFKRHWDFPSFRRGDASPRETGASTEHPPPTSPLA